jgi:hypothetical protein
MKQKSVYIIAFLILAAILAGAIVFRYFNLDMGSSIKCPNYGY